jgi:hypothetical protein
MLSKVCFEQKVSRRAQSFPLKGNRRVETLRRLSKSKISEEITKTDSKLKEITLTREKTRSKRRTRRRKVKGRSL